MPSISKSSQMDYKEIRVQIDEESGLAHVQLTRPDATLTLQTLSEIIKLCSWLNQQDSVKVIIFSSASNIFCAGMSLSSFSLTRVDSDHNQVYRDVDLGRQMVEAVESLVAISIAIIHGGCVGGGFVLASACDLRICSDDAFFLLPEVKQVI
jgi:enoyl-CoA hydratase/carnithine racemase